MRVLVMPAGIMILSVHRFRIGQRSMVDRTDFLYQSL